MGNATGYTLVLCALLSQGCVSGLGVTNENQFASLEREARVRELQIQVRRAPDDMRARYEIVRVYLEELLFEQAERDLKAIIALNPKETRAYEQLAITLTGKPRPDVTAAMSWLNEALKVAPTAPTIHSTMALLLLDIGDLGSAQERAEHALRYSATEAGEVEARLLLAAIHEQLGEESEARWQASIAVSIDPSALSIRRPAIRIPAYVGPLPRWFPQTHPETGGRIRAADKRTRD